jgi:hypothetical protein
MTPDAAVAKPPESRTLHASIRAPILAQGSLGGVIKSSFLTANLTSISIHEFINTHDILDTKRRGARPAPGVGVTRCSHGKRSKWLQVELSCGLRTSLTSTSVIVSDHCPLFWGTTFQA